MDEKLKAIQAELDKVLDKLSEYMNDEHLRSAGEAETPNRVDAARAVLNYA